MALLAGGRRGEPPAQHAGERDEAGGAEARRAAARRPRSCPDRRIVAYYGAPQDDELGALGIGTPAHAARRLERQAKPYATPARPVLPALELLAVTAAAHPGRRASATTRASPTASSTAT